MADPRFFTNAGPFTLAEIAKACEAECAGDAAVSIRDLAALDAAQADELSFLENRSYKDQARQTKAAAVFVKAEEKDILPEGCAALVSRYPYRSHALATALFYPPNRQPDNYSEGERDIHSSARVHASAVLGANVTIGENSVIEANVTIGQGCVIGKDCVIMAGSSVSHALLGDRVRVFPGARVGQPGFGYAIDPKGNHLHVQQLGRVILEDGVEIGANSTVDRGAGPDTVIGAGTKIDNLCQIGHNVKVGRGCFMAGMVGISGSTTIGNGVFIGGQVGMAGHLKIGDGAQIAAKTGILQDVEAGAKIMGYPAVGLAEFMRREAWLRRAIRSKKDA